MSDRSIHLSIRGHVQGVGYRAWVADQADALGLSGWVRNRRDGSVEAVVAGTTQAIDDLIARAWDGPSHASVTAVDVTDSEAQVGSGFRVLPTE